jgi:DNA primase catalytic subunit
MDIRRYYKDAPLEVPAFWNLSRKHFRIVIWNGKYLKLNKFRNRLGIRELKYYCVKYAPIHVYFSVLDCLFPERVGKKYKANYAVPIGGEYVFDVDGNNVWIPHSHDSLNPVCRECLFNSKMITLQILDAMEENYSKIQIVFSGRRGFHIHVLDFDYRDWTRYDERNLIKSYEVARFKYSKHLASVCYGFNRPHFIVATDPMRVISLQYSLNGRSGLVCVPVGNRKSLEKLDIGSLVLKASPLQEAKSLTALDLVYAHPEL